MKIEVASTCSSKGMGENGLFDSLACHQQTPLSHKRHRNALLVQGELLHTVNSASISISTRIISLSYWSFAEIGKGKATGNALSSFCSAVFRNPRAQENRHHELSTYLERAAARRRLHGTGRRDRTTTLPKPYSHSTETDNESENQPDKKRMKSPQKENRLYFQL